MEDRGPQPDFSSLEREFADKQGVRGPVQNGPRGSELEWQMSVWFFAKLNIAMDGYRSNTHEYVLVHKLAHLFLCSVS